MEQKTETIYRRPFKLPSFECEFKSEEKWNKVITNDLTRIINEDRAGNVRVKMLDEGDIISEGWEKKPSQSRSIVFKKGSGRRWLTMWFSGDMISIEASVSPTSTQGSQIYRGFCPDINTFKIIQNLLGI